MSCRICTYVGQYFLNFANLLDHTLNFLLLGDTNETVSCRTARARAAGQKWAVYACNILTFGAKVVTFGTYVGDHCTNSLNPANLPNSREIWSWSKMELNPTPITIIDDEEIDPPLA